MVEPAVLRQGSSQGSRVQVWGLLLLVSWSSCELEGKVDHPNVKEGGMEALVIFQWKKLDLFDNWAFPGCLRPPHPPSHQEVKATMTWWLPSLVSGWHPPATYRQQKQRADSDVQTAGWGAHSCSTKATWSVQHSFSCLLHCLSWKDDYGNPGVDTQEVLKRFWGGKQRPLRVTTTSQCPLDQLLSYPSSSAGVGAQDCMPADTSEWGPEGPLPANKTTRLPHDPVWLKVLHISVGLPELWDSISTPP